jgi:hypothetical protein
MTYKENNYNIFNNVLMFGTYNNNNYNINVNIYTFFHDDRATTTKKYQYD